MFCRFMGVFVVMFAALSLAACGAQTQVGNAGETTVASEPEVFFPQQKSESSSPMARISGEFYRDKEGCLRLKTPDGVPFTPIWRQSMKPRVKGDTVAVVDEKGRVLARTGRYVRMGGGEPGSLNNLPAVSEKTARELKERCPGGYWLVGFEVRMPPAERTHS